MYSKYWLHSDEAMVQLFALSSAIWIRIQHTDPDSNCWKECSFQKQMTIKLLCCFLSLLIQQL